MYKNVIYCGSTINQQKPGNNTTITVLKNHILNVNEGFNIYPAHKRNNHIL